MNEVSTDVHAPLGCGPASGTMGVGPFLADKIFEPHDIRFRRWSDGRLIENTKLMPDFRESFGAPYYVVHRVHFHEVLYERAKELNVDVRVNSKVVKYELKAPAVMLDNSIILRADLVVAADGLNSTARQLILQAPEPARFYSCRAVVPIERIRADSGSTGLPDKPLWTCGSDRVGMS